MPLNDKSYYGLEKDVHIESDTALHSDVPLTTASGVGSIPTAAASYVAVTEYGDGALHKTVLTCTALPITVADEGGAGQYGGVQAYDFPEGLLLTLGAVIDGAITMVDPIIDAWDGDIALGTAAPSDHATGLVVGDTGRFLQSTATTQAATKVANVDAISAATGLTESGARWTDGTATAANLFLNLLIDDSAAHEGVTGSFTGTITIAWMILGDK